MTTRAWNHDGACRYRQRLGRCPAINGTTNQVVNRSSAGQNHSRSQDSAGALLPMIRSCAEAVGVAVCFVGFSTFKARPLLNIHDLAVIPTHRGRGVGRKLLDAVERKARERGCCSVTLEVLEKNVGARRLYAAAGFGQPTYNEGQGGGALFLSKPL
jgi:ribosomal protein S18 acetylase RimI-like enzyme